MTQERWGLDFWRSGASMNLLVNHARTREATMTAVPTRMPWPVPSVAVMPCRPPAWEAVDVEK